jgi:hypothetical protein
MDAQAQAIDSEHEAEASYPGSLNSRPSVRCAVQLKNYEETFTKPDFDLSK